MMEIDRSEYTRVTSVLGAFTDWSFVSPEVLSRKCEIGTTTHRAIELILSGEDPGVLPEEVIPYVDSFKKFWEGSSHAWQDGEIILEKRMYSDLNRLSGQADVTIVCDDRTLIIDWKTSASYSKNFRLQAAAYRFLATEEGFKNVQTPIFVRLKKDGSKPAMHKVDDDSEDMKTFFECLNVFRWFGYDKRPKR